MKGTSCLFGTVIVGIIALTAARPVSVPSARTLLGELGLVDGYRLIYRKTCAQIIEMGAAIIALWVRLFLLFGERRDCIPSPCIHLNLLVGLGCPGLDETSRPKICHAQSIMGLRGRTDAVFCFCA
jgi:hypothetical protein